MVRKIPAQLALLLFAIMALSSPAALAQDARDGKDGSDAPARPGVVPTGVIIVKGAEPSASDHRTPLPESGNAGREWYENQYFRLSFPIPTDWSEKFKGPPPSDSGSYVLTQLRPTAAFKGPNKATILVTAQDLFFSLAPSRSAMELIQRSSEQLPSYYKVERPPAAVRIGNHAFARFDYMSPAAELHWSVLATEIRCHAVQFVFTSRDTSLLEALVQNMEKMKVPETGSAAVSDDDFPTCIRDYARAENLTYKVDPVLTDRRFNPIPVRIIIGKNGRVKHIHLISAFPEQASAITDALLQWRFKPLLQNGEPVEVETGILFGSAPASRTSPVVQKPYPTPAEALKATSQ
jgi:hypothetical protein